MHHCQAKNKAEEETLKYKHEVLFWAYRAIQEVLGYGDMVVWHTVGNQAPVFCTPQDAVKVRKVLENVVTFLSPVTQCPVSHF